MIQINVRGSRMNVQNAAVMVRAIEVSYRNSYVPPHQIRRCFVREEEEETES